MRSSTKRVVVAGFVASMFVAFAAVAHAGFAPLPKNDGVDTAAVERSSSLLGFRAPGALVLCLAGAAMMCLPRAKA